MIPRAHVVLLTIAALLCCGVIIDRIRAIVNDTIITESEVYATEKLNLDLSGLPPTDNTLQSRIDHHLIVDEFAKQPPIRLPDEEVAQAIDSYGNRFPGQEEFSSFLSSIGMNYSDFESEVRQQLTIRHFVRDRFRPFVNIPVEEAESYYEKFYVPQMQKAGREVPSFPESFDQIQNLLLERKVEDRVKEWLLELRASAQIAIKD